MKKLSEKELLIALIKDDLINHRLVMGLNRLGLVNELYFIDAGNTVFKLMGIEEKIGHEIHFARYMNLKDKVLKLDFEKHNQRFEVNGMAEKIYRELLAIKKAGK